MALFALWREDQATGSAASLRTRLRDTAHIVPQCEHFMPVATGGGRWQVAALATATRFYPAAAQFWSDGQEACVIHGLIWRIAGERAALLDAAEVAALLDRPGKALPTDVAGEFAVARLHACGTLTAFSDAAGLHQLFRRADRPAMIANRARWLAELGQDGVADPGLWTSTIGYRVGTATGWRGVSQLPQARMLVSGPGGAALRAIADPAAAVGGERGFDEALLDEGMAQGRAAIRLAAGDGRLDLPITGGKDSRAVLALALSAGLGERLTLFTRGHDGHPDIAAGRTIAAALGLPHRREPPLGSDIATDWTVDHFAAEMAALAWQSDGGIGGWDLITGAKLGQDTLVTGHMGEVLKAYAKRAPTADGDPIALVRLQAPFDPLGLLLPGARAALAEELADGFAVMRRAGATDADLPDLFYYRNRVPNWLGGIRAIKSFERQPVMPLGAPALQALAFRMTAAERKAERAHYEIVRRAAPALLALPFAHQSWDASLAAQQTAPLVAAAGTKLFGTWQYSINRNAGVRAFLSDILGRAEGRLWEGLDRGALLTALRERRFDYFDGIQLLGLTVAAMHAAGLGRPTRMSERGRQDEPLPEALARLAARPAPRLAGHVDTVERDAAGAMRLGGWLWAPDWPGAAPAIEAHGADGRLLARTGSELPRPDLPDGGAHGFALDIAAEMARPDETITLTGFASADGPAGGRVEAVA
ncbi:hypothetical protein [Sphingomonas quercus]|uniref:Asparagine synthetase domain-containing protein n=1 Tax=Sphingomonas quercus TaxID=2842451 RepID=A0ABS6BFC0_9SPHN|nr:hypothetical protein [Sphingomonas quercus]MBU3076998.1 hypothetical protein [Sphingomonas quercus]